MTYRKYTVGFDWSAGKDETIKTTWICNADGKWEMVIHMADVTNTQASATRAEVLKQLEEMNVALDTLRSLWGDGAVSEHILTMCKYLSEYNAVLLASLTHIVLELSDKQNPDRYNGVK